MKAAQILDVVVHAIQTRPPSDCRMYHLCFIDGEIQCLPTIDKPQPEILFGTYSNDNLTKGLAIAEWGRLEGKIRIFLQQKGLL